MTERQHGGWGPPIREFKNAHGGEITLTAEDREALRERVRAAIVALQQRALTGEASAARVGPP